MLITGACGNIGRKLRAAWEDVYDLILLDANPGEDDHDVFKADLSVFDEEWITHFHGVDTVVHLAANSNELCDLDELIGPNLDALANVFNAAALAGVDRIVFASSNHVMGGVQGPRRRTDHGRPRSSARQSLRDAQARGRADGTEPGPCLRPYLHRAADRLGPGGTKSPRYLARRLGQEDVAIQPRPRPTVRCGRGSRDRGFARSWSSTASRGTTATRWDLTDSAEILGYLPEDDAFAVHERAGTVDELS